MAKLVSPNDMQKAAEEHMLAGQKPETNEDWQLCANFWANNIESGLEETCLPVLGLILGCPLPRRELIKIARFQAERKPS